MAQPVTFHCPHCSQAYQVTPEQASEYAGQTITCTACRKAFVVPPEITTVAAQAAYPQQPYPGPAPSQQVSYASPMAGRGTSGLAITSLVCGCLLCVPVLPGVLGTLFGILGLKATRDERTGGRGLAIAGLILGILNIAGWALYFVMIAAVMFPALGAARQQASRVKCANNLRQIGQGLLLYANDQRAYPANLGALITDEDVNPIVFVCPESNGTPASGATPQAQAANLTAGGHLSYVYVGAKIRPGSSPNSVMVYEPLSDHRQMGANFLFEDGRVNWYNAQTSQRAIQELQQGLNPPPSLNGK